MWLKVFIVNFLALLSVGNCGLPLVDSVESVRENKFLSQTPPVTFNNDEFTTYRLPNDTRPLNYDITIRTDIHLGIFDFTGNVRINVVVVEPTNVITLHYRLINITNVDVRYPNGTAQYPNVNFNLVPTRDFLRIPLPVTHNINDTFVIEIQYNGVLRTGGLGFFRRNYTDNQGVHWYATTQFEIDEARSALPCYDEPAIRAPMQLTMIHGSNYHAVSNTNVLQTGAFPGGLRRTIFEPTPSIQTYLLAFLVSDFKYVGYNGTRVQQKVYAEPSLIEDGYGDFATTIIGPILDKHEEILGVDYPLDKMDHAAIREFIFGAMENIGMMNYAFTALLYPPNAPPIEQITRKMRIIRVVAHEFAHQWSGNIVSPMWWSYIWLNEGLATFHDTYIPSLLYPEYNFMERFVTIVMPSSFALDARATTWSMNHYTEVPAELWTKFNPIAYEKSSCIIRMFQQALTVATFTKGLNNYFSKMYMKPAVPDDLYSSLQWAYDADFPSNDLNIAQLFDTWASQAGYPVVSVEKFEDRFLISQKRHLLNYGEIYSIPLTLATKSNRNFDEKTPKAWLKAQSMTMAYSQANFNADDWIILNLQQVGYYRVDYSTELWHAIINQLKSDHLAIHEINRAVLQDEIYLGWTEFNRLDAQNVLDVLTYLEKDDYHVTWSKASNTLTLLSARLFGTDKAYQNYQRLLAHIAKPHLEEHGLDYVDYETSNITSLRNNARRWSCLGYDKDCLDNEKRKFMEYYETGTASSSFDLCHALRNIDSDIYAQLVIGVATNTSYINYLDGLGCNLVEENLKKFLQISIETTTQNILTDDQREDVIKNVFNKSPLALDVGLSFVKENHDAIYNIIPNGLIDILRSLATLINTNSYADRFESILGDLTRMEAITREDELTLRSTYAANLRWHSTNFQLIEEWFDTWTPDNNLESSSSSFILSTVAIAVGILIQFII